jgi:predicted alpha/beta-hydrolase family hydrolase
MRPITTTTWTVPVGGDTTTAVLDPATTGSPTAVFVCAHGAGGNMSDRGVLATSDAIRARGIHVVRFNFLYTEKRSGRPDPMPRLEECTTAVVAHVRKEIEPDVLIIGGRSMGGRAASMLASKGFDCAGLLLLAYPLHPAGRPDQLRDAHLPSIRMPVLCFNGTRDALCTPELMERALERVTAPWRMHWVETADHSFHVLKRSGRTDAEVMHEIGDTTAAWIAGLSAQRA